MKRFLTGLFLGLSFLAVLDHAMATGKCPDGGNCDRLRCGTNQCVCQNVNGNWECNDYNPNEEPGPGGGS